MTLIFYKKKNISCNEIFSISDTRLQNLVYTFFLAKSNNIYVFK